MASPYQHSRLHAFLAIFQDVRTVPLLISVLIAVTDLSPMDRAIPALITVVSVIVFYVIILPAVLDVIQDISYPQARHLVFYVP